MFSPNPYASPQYETFTTITRHGQLHVVQRIYWWVGIVGTTVCGLYVGIFVLAALTDAIEIQRDEIATLLLISMTTCFHILFFNYCRITANRLSTKPARFRRRCRLVGFAMATLYFPILTAPGLYCVWKIDKYFEPRGEADSEQPD